MIHPRFIDRQIVIQCVIHDNNPHPSSSSSSLNLCISSFVYISRISILVDQISSSSSSMDIGHHTYLFWTISSVEGQQRSRSGSSSSSDTTITTTSAMNIGHNFLFRPKEWSLALVLFITRRLSVLFLNMHNMYVMLCT